MREGEFELDLFLNAHKYRQIGRRDYVFQFQLVSTRKGWDKMYPPKKAFTRTVKAFFGIY